MRESNILMFEPFRLDVGDERLWRGEEVVRLTNKAFAVLRHLAGHPRQLVTKSELLDAVWPGAYVSEAAMTVCIRELRKALGDDAQAPRFIETVRGRGYRFLAPVTMADRSQPSLRGDALLRTALPQMPSIQESSPMQPTSPVGRETELSRLQQWYATALAGVRQVGFVVGEVGIGKTTLVEAFVAQLQGESSVWVGHGQCVDQYGTGEAYLPVLEAIGRLCRGPEGGQLLTLLRQQAPSWLLQMPTLLSAAEREELQRAESGATQSRMLRELTEAVELLTAERSLVLVLEDLHWSDASTLAWLGYLARRREVARLLVLGTYRPVEAIVAAQPLRSLAQELRRHEQCEELLLDYLSEAAVAAYLARRCPGHKLPAGLAQTLHQRTDGNPLFLVTLVDTLLRQGALAESRSGWQLPGGLGAVTEGVPESLRQLIEQHLEQVSPEGRKILEAASVVGAEFSAAAVAAVVEQRAEVVEMCCEDLARRGQFVQPRGSTTWPDGTVSARYGFIHALYQEVLYQRIPAGKRVQVHRQIGLGLEAGYGEQVREIAAELAEHFVRGRDASRAVRFLRYAGENALQRSAYQEAIAHLSKGLEVLDTLPDSVERAQQEVGLQSTLGLTYMAAKGYAAPEVGSAFARSRALCQQMSKAPQLVPVLRGLWGYHLARAELHRAREMAEQLLRLGQETQDPEALGSAHHGLGQILFNMGEFSSAQEHFEQALALFSHQSLSSAVALRAVQDGRVICLGFVAFCLWHLGYPDQAMQKVQEALGLARELSHPFTLAYALHLDASIHAYCGKFATAYERNQELLALSVAQGYPLFEAGSRFAQCAMLVRQGQLEIGKGIVQMRHSIDAFRATGAESGLPKILAVMVEVQRDAGQIGEALASLAEAQAAVERSGERRYETELSLLKGALLLEPVSREQDAGETRKKSKEAGACFRHAVDVARQQKAKSLELQAVMSVSRLWQQQGKLEEARQLLEEVYGWFTEGFDTADLRAAKTLLAELG